ncbi:MAG: hypothetical protein OXI63_05755 [Candidatus Poribacteria bacterium]|nr:hypothetical protein [Candidatus Poribacteria bacterium]
MRRIVSALLFGLTLSMWHIIHGAWADKIVFACFPDGQTHSDICMINSDGSDLRRLTEIPKRKDTPVWSPDKKTIAFGNANKIWLMDTDGNNLRVLKEGFTFDRRLAWSPDGRKIAYGVIFAINIIDIHTKEETLLKLPQNMVRIKDVAWSPDGHQLAFAADADLPTRDIYVVNTDYVHNEEGIGLRQLTQHPGEDRKPAWTPDGKQIAFYSTRNESGGIFFMDADGQNITELTHEGENASSWSPDGKQMAVHVYPGPPVIGAEGIAAGPLPGKPHIRVMDADGRNSEFIAVGHSPSWQSTFPGLAVHPNEKLASIWGQIKSDDGLR